MFYLSKSEQVAVVVLIALLVAGAGVLAYTRGQQAAPAEPGPLFVEAPARALRAAPAEEPGGPGAAAPSRARLLSLNAATKEQLQGLPGIGPVYAEGIITYRERLRREEGRGFRSIDELLNVPGIGPRRLVGLRDYVVP